MSVMLTRIGRRAATALVAGACLVLATPAPGLALPPENDEPSGAKLVSLGSVYRVDTTEATNGLEDPPCEESSSTIHRTVWFGYVPAQDMTVVARAIPSAGFDAEIAALEAFGTTVTHLGCEDRSWEAQTENMRLDLVAGREYYFMIGNARPNEPGGTLRFDLHLPVKIQPDPDEQSWFEKRSGTTVVTGRVKCNRRVNIDVHAELSQGPSFAEGRRRVTCSSSSSRPWSVRLDTYFGDGFDATEATLDVGFFYDDDGVEVLRKQTVEVVICTKVGTVGPDRISGGRGTDRLCGLYGDDDLYTNAGRDVLFGGPGDDLLVGGPGGDRLFGGEGKDRLEGQDGRDMLSGERGNDLLVGGAHRDVCRGGPGRDRRRSCER